MLSSRDILQFLAAIFTYQPVRTCTSASCWWVLAVKCPIPQILSRLVYYWGTGTSKPYSVRFMRPLIGSVWLSVSILIRAGSKFADTHVHVSLSVSLFCLMSLCCVLKWHTYMTCRYMHLCSLTYVCVYQFNLHLFANGFSTKQQVLDRHHALTNHMTTPS